MLYFVNIVVVRVSVSYLLSYVYQCCISLVIVVTNDVELILGYRLRDVHLKPLHVLQYSVSVPVNRS